MPSGFGAASIGGVAFHIRESEQDFFPLPIQEVIDEITHIPYSDINIVDHGGKGPYRLQTVVVVEPADRAGFEAMNGVVGTLVLYGTTIGDAKMKITAASAHSLLLQYRYAIELIW